MSWVTARHCTLVELNIELVGKEIELYSRVLLFTFIIPILSVVLVGLEPKSWPLTSHLILPVELGALTVQVKVTLGSRCSDTTLVTGP